jgi:hypothetical protein
LRKHAANFGSFALEYDLGDLRSLGALPVFYLPGPSVNQTNNLGGVGLVLTNRIIETWVVLQRLVALDQFRNGHPDHVDTPVLSRALKQLLEGVTELRQIEFTAQASLNLLYPTEDPQYNWTLSYYHQREWKLISNFAIGTRWDVAPANPKQIAYLINLDPDVFGGLLPDAGRPRAHDCMFCRQLLGEPVPTKARSLIVRRRHRSSQSFSKSALSGSESRGTLVR